MALTDEEAALLTITDLEIEWLRKVAVNIDPNSLSDLRALVMPDGPHPYWAATGSISDISRAFYAENLP